MDLTVIMHEVILAKMSAILMYVTANIVIILGILYNNTLRSVLNINYTIL